MMSCRWRWTAQKKYAGDGTLSGTDIAKDIIILNSHEILAGLLKLRESTAHFFFYYLIIFSYFHTFYEKYIMSYRK